MEEVVADAPERNGTEPTTSTDTGAELRVMVEIHPELVLAHGKTQTRYPEGMKVLLTVASARALAAQITRLIGALDQ